MSAPQTDVEKQAKRHRGPIWGITIVVLLALTLLLFLIFNQVGEGNVPDSDTPQTEFGTGSDLTTGETTPEPAADGLAPGVEDEANASQDQALDTVDQATEQDPGETEEAVPAE